MKIEQNGTPRSKQPTHTTYLSAVSQRLCLFGDQGERVHRAATHFALSIFVAYLSQSHSKPAQLKPTNKSTGTMETLKSGQVPALVTNAEVMQILAARTEARDKHDAEAAAAAEGSATNGGGRSGAKRKRRVDDTKRHRHRDWIESKLLDYLQTSSCGTIGSDGSGNIDSSKLPQLVGILRAPPSKRGKGPGNGNDVKMKSKNGGNDAATADHADNGNDSAEHQIRNGYGLTDGETLQILNHMPSELVELHLIIEDLPSRMSDERQEELLQLIGTYAGRDANQD